MTTQKELDEWDNQGRRYDLTGHPVLGALLVVVAFPVAVAATIVEATGRALRRAVSVLRT